MPLLYFRSYSPLLMAAIIFVSALAGLQPSFLSIQTLFFLCVVVFFRIPLFLTFALIAVFYVAGGIFLDSVSHSVGLAILNSTALSAFWGALSEVPVVALTQFNNTMFMGSFVFSVFFGLCGYFIWKIFIRPKVLS